MTPKILVVEDEEALMTLLVYNLESEATRSNRQRTGKKLCCLPARKSLI